MTLSHHMRRGLKIWTAGCAFMAFAVGGCASSAETTGTPVWPPAPERPRIKFVRTWSGGDVMSRSFLSRAMETLAGIGEANVTLKKPHGIAVDARGRVFVTDLQTHRLVVFDFHENSLRSIGDAGAFRLLAPMGVAVHDTIIYVSDPQLKRVVLYHVSGTFIASYGADADFKNPVAVGVHPATGRIYAVDAGRHEIVVFSRDGAIVNRFGSERGKESSLYYPSGIDFLGDTVCVVDAMNFRVALFAPDGSYLKSFGQAGSSPGFFARPKGIAVAPDGKIFISDGAFDNFQIFDHEGQVYMFVGGAGIGQGEFSLPQGMCFGPQSRLYVVDQLNSRVQVFDYLESQ